MVAASTLQPRILALADRIGRLTVNHRNPEAFYVERSDIEDELRRLGENTTRDGEVYVALRSIKVKARV